MGNEYRPTRLSTGTETIESLAAREPLEASSGAHDKPTPYANYASWWRSLKMEKMTTDKPYLLYVGIKDGEEYYQDTREKDGWSFMGLRPATEAELREQARNTDAADMLGISPRDWDVIWPYFDEDKFSHDMEEEWESRHDVQAERYEEDGETLYLGFGSGQDAKGYFKKHGITDYASYAEHFESAGLSVVEFKSFAKKYL